jgi:hypothetical protein
MILIIFIFDFETYQTTDGSNLWMPECPWLIIIIIILQQKQIHT